MRRRTPSDDRRRRMLVEESPHEAPQKKKARGGAATEYAADTMGQQPQCIDFLPRRGWLHLALWFVTGLGVAGLVMLDRWQQARSDGPWEIFQLQHPASLATWCVTVGLLLVAVLSLSIFSLRRHRQSDYHTRYRWWIWVSATALFSSVAALTGWQEVAARATASLSGWNIPGGHQLFWLAPVGLLYSFLALRLILELRGCRLAMLAVVASWSAFCFRSVMILDFDFGVFQAWKGTLEGACVVSMVALLCCGLLWYARYVLLDVEGRLPVREPKRKATISEDGSTAKSSRHPTPRGPSDLEPETRRRAAELIDESDYDSDDPDTELPAKRKRQESRKQATNADIEMESAEMPEHRQHQQQKKLSKAERKKLRRLKAKQRHAA
ncbi:MAG: hypothetical protein VX431_04925 [Planctomycetota bacterium]|nr:hypothetical protein [Planctomycetota bacterium]